MSQSGRLEQIRAELEIRKLIGPAPRPRSQASTTTDTGPRLRQALVAMGQLFALFGHYLAGRTDRLPLHQCRELQKIPIAVEPTPMAVVGRILTSHLGCPVNEHFATFDEPRRTTLLHQWHHAELRDGTAVTVKLVRPEARTLVDRELENLPILEELRLGAADLSSVIEDFVVWVDRQLDLGREAVGLDRLAAQVGGFDAIEVPLQQTIPAGRNIIVTRRTIGSALEDRISTAINQQPKLAHRLCQTWLQQSLLEGACPEGPLLENTRLLSNERFAIIGGLVTTLDRSWRRHLLDAVIATSRRDPDRMGEALLSVSTEAENAEDWRRVRSSLRQAEAFRCNGWTEDYSGRHIADDFFVHLRLLSDMGHLPKNYTVSFVRGFSEIESIARLLAPDTDAMAGAIDDLRLVAAAADLRSHLGPKAMIRAAEELTPVIGEILDDPTRLTSRLAGGGDRPGTDDSSTNPSAMSWQVFVALLAVLAAGTIIGVAAIRAHPDQSWLEWTVTLGFIVLTAGIFRLVGKPVDR